MAGALYTIGFAGKPAREFFGLLAEAKVRRLTDIRRWPDAQLSGFAKKRDLPYFLSLRGIAYEHRPDCAPTEELLKSYKAGKTSWAEYEKIYSGMLDGRRLLCAEPTPDHCHRRLLAE